MSECVCLLYGRFNDLYSRYSSLVTAAPPTASTTTGSSKRTSAPATSSATTTSSAYTYTPYVPLSRRRPISDISDIGEKSRDLSLLAKGGVPDRQIATVGGCTSPGATGQRRSCTNYLHCNAFAVLILRNRADGFLMQTFN